jgi:hypothetical protein
MSETTAELVDVEPASTELVPAAPVTVFGTSDPDVALERMAALARRLVDVVRDQKLAVKIQGREHLRVEAWTTLGGMLGIFPIVTWTRPNEAGDGYVARVEVRTRAGELVGAAEAECSRSEKVWHDRYPYSLRGMAQTRAISRALRAPLGQIVTLAGYDATPLEEMPAEVESPGGSTGDSAHDSKPRSPVEGAEPSREQKAEISTLVRTLELADPAIDWAARCVEISGVPGRMLTRTGAEMLIEKLREQLAAQLQEAE